MKADRYRADDPGPEPLCKYPARWKSRRTSSTPIPPTHGRERQTSSPTWCPWPPAAPELTRASTERLAAAAQTGGDRDVSRGRSLSSSCSSSSGPDSWTLPTCRSARARSLRTTGSVLVGPTDIFMRSGRLGSPGRLRTRRSPIAGAGLGTIPKVRESPPFPRLPCSGRHWRRGQRSRNCPRSPRANRRRLQHPPLKKPGRQRTRPRTKRRGSLASSADRIPGRKNR